jgi:hypothetical protein
MLHDPPSSTNREILMLPASFPDGKVLLTLFLMLHASTTARGIQLLILPDSTPPLGENC